MATTAQDPIDPEDSDILIYFFLTISDNILTISVLLTMMATTTQEPNGAEDSGWPRTLSVRSPFSSLSLSLSVKSLLPSLSLSLSL